MTKVSYTDFIRKDRKDGTCYYVEETQGKATFLAFGLDYEELEHGVGTYSVAILRLGDGSLINVPTERVTFLELPLLSFNSLSLRRLPHGSYWLERPDGEGMEILGADLEQALNSYYKERF